MRRALGRHLALLAALVAPPVKAERAATAALSWVRGEGAESCPAEAEVVRAVEQRLGQPTLVPRARAELVLDVQLTAKPQGGYRADLTMLRGDEVVGRRDLESESPWCQVVAANAALVIALAIDPDVSLEPLPLEATRAEPPAPFASSDPAPEVEPPKRAPAPAVVREGPPWQADLELGAGLAIGIVPNVAPGVFVRGRALPPRLPFGLELSGAFFPSQRIEALPGKGADLSEFYAGLALCSRPSRESRLRGSLCAGADLGAVVGQGYGFSANPRFVAFTLALAARGRLGFRLVPGLAVVLGPDVELPLKRDYFEAKPVSGTERLFRMSALGLGFELGVVWEL